MRWWALRSWALVGFLMATGCYGYAYHQRGPAPNFERLPIDTQKPYETTRWSYFWGLQRDQWTPSECASDGSIADEECQKIVQLCDGKGPGRVEVGWRWYSAPLLLVTLGIAAPSRVTVFCSTFEAPDVGP